MKVDAHQHFWRYNPEEYDWMGSGMEALKADHLPVACELVGMFPEQRFVLDHVAKPFIFYKLVD